MANFIDLSEYLRGLLKTDSVLSNEQRPSLSLPFGSILEGALKDDLTNWAEPFEPKSAARVLSRRFDRLGPARFLAIQEEFGIIPDEWRDTGMVGIFMEFVAQENTDPEEFLAQVVRRYRSKLNEDKGH